ncbi:MAG: hypothetical protein AAF430_00705 [Myxococcota bacterium]
MVGAASLGSVDAALRSGSRSTLSAPSLAALFAIIGVSGALYGAALGGYSATHGALSRQVLYSAAKVPLLIVVTFAISLPSFFVLNALLGLRSQLRPAIGALLTAQACAAIALASFAPITILWYASWNDYQAAKLFNAFAFGSASLLAQLPLRRLYAPLLAHQPRSRWLLRAWLVIYGFVGIQLAWVLRPFVGSPSLEPRFLREGAWGNAYLHLVEVISDVLEKL